MPLYAADDSVASEPAARDGAEAMVAKVQKTGAAAAVYPRLALLFVSGTEAIVVTRRKNRLNNTENSTKDSLPIKAGSL